MYPKDFKNIRTYGNILEHILEIPNPEMLWQSWKRRAPENDEDPSNKILEILNSRSISITKIQMEIWLF